MECRYCRFGGGKHDVACPNSMEDDAKVRAQQAWEKGYRAGRSGEPEPTDASATYSLGYGRGIVALEEAENGFDPRFEDSADPSEKELWDEYDDRIDEYMDIEFGD